MADLNNQYTLFTLENNGKTTLRMETVTISALRAKLLTYSTMVSEGHEIVVISHGEILASIVLLADRFRQHEQVGTAGKNSAAT